MGINKTKDSFLKLSQSSSWHSLRVWQR